MLQRLSSTTRRVTPLPACDLPRPIEPASQLPLRLDDLALQYRISHDILTVLRPDPGQPHALCYLYRGTAALRRAQHARCVAAAVHKHVGAELVPADVADEVDAAATGPLVVMIAVQAERAQVSFKLALQQRRRLPAARVARLLATEQNKVFVWARTQGEGRGERRQREAVAEGCGRCGSSRDEVEEGGRGRRVHVVDVGEGGEEKDRRAHGCGGMGVVSGHIGGRKHEGLGRACQLELERCTKDVQCTYSVRRGLRFANGFHDGAHLVRHISDPIRLPGRNNQVRGESIHMAVKLLFLIDDELGRESRRARRAVVQAVVAINGWVRLGKELIYGCSDESVGIRSCLGGSA